MNNETTASQPKSIGDDARFQFALHRYCNGEMFEREFIAVIDSRAPAAQASATIQAAPVITGQQAIQALTSAMNHAEINVDQRAHLLGFFSNEWNKCLAAIQEPVMMAEPVGVTTWQERAKAKKDWPIFSGDTASIYMAEEIEDWRSRAAPMVADPAGVAELPSEVLDARLQDIDFLLSSADKYLSKKSASYPVTKGECELDTALFELLAARKHIKNLLHPQPVSLAATVKAVPSEALDEAAAYRMWRDCEISEDSWFMQHLADYLPAECRQRAPTTAEWDAAMARVMQDRAPLADKTGGGE